MALDEVVIALSGSLRVASRASDLDLALPSRKKHVSAHQLRIIHIGRPSMSTFSVSPVPHPQSASQPQAFSRRPYRSKRNRPCTLCRSRKISCRVLDEAVSCTSCRKSGRHCSFLDEPSSNARTGNVESHVLGTSNNRESDSLTQGQPFDWATNDEMLNQSLVHENFRGRDGMELSTFYDMPQDMESFEFDPSLHNIDPDLRPRGFYNPLDGTSVANVDDSNADGVLGNALAHHFPSPNRSSNLDSIDPQPLTGHTRTIEPSSEARSIDERPRFHSSHFGLSGECDPYLLRHMLYNEDDEKPFNRLWYRATQPKLYDSSLNTLGSSMAGSPKSHVPTQFMLVANELVEEVKKVGPVHSVRSSQSQQKELRGLVSDEHGRRLIFLFIEYVFPALPVISRSQLVRNTLITCSSQSQSLYAIPSYLLAAIYASALQFGSYDDVLCVSSLYQKPSSEVLWQMVYDGIQSQVHSPRLDTLSAALLYLNKPRVGVQQISVDTPFTWTFTASTVALATSLGLHMDCCAWNIPKWEKRLRRRLWWMTFSEEKWRSLLLGRPSIIARDQWSVSNLIDQDFEMNAANELDYQQPLPEEVKVFLKSLRSSGTTLNNALLSQRMVTLALIADEVYTNLYTIRAAQSLAEDLAASISAVRPLRESLVFWYSTLPATLQSSKKTSSEISSVPLVPNSVACLHFAYITLEVLLYRALLRPLANVDFDQDLVDSQTEGQGTAAFTTSTTSSSVPDSRWDVGAFISTAGEPQAGFRSRTEAIICAAEKCATVVTTFTAEMMSWDFAGFWYSWSRIGWATTSSFMALLLVQSPSIEHARTAKSLMDKWRQILRHQSKSFQDMSLGMTRLDAMYWSDMRKLFRVNRHLDKVLDGSRY